MTQMKTGPLAGEDASLELLGADLAGAIECGLIEPQQLPDASSLLKQLELLESRSAERRLTRFVETLDELRERTRASYDSDTVEHLLANTFAPMCASLGFRRALMSTIDGRTWKPESLYIDEGLSGTESGLRSYLDQVTIDLVDAPLEANALRQRRPCLVSSPQTHKHTFKPLMSVSNSQGYVVAPVVSRTRVVGMVHADQFEDPATPTDRDKITVLTGTLGLAVEGVSQGRRLTSFLDRVENIVSVSLRRSEAGTQSGPVAGDAAITGSRGVSAMTPRQHRVLGYLANGYTNAQIARELGVSEATVKTHISHIFRKMGVRSRAAAAAAYSTDGGRRRRS
ncbi:LuxR C-terminal-related transcriptional regulator [Rhodococcus sp. NPDC127530]|uniref:LuxR C-terminal-related transcriptional regulator n=1 Tax=unclassified Rhodococcus (in: high G+C Gram-positive bacteria) TaxID=192944 RepID=UPI003625E9A0